MEFLSLENVFFIIFFGLMSYTAFITWKNDKTNKETQEKTYVQWIGKIDTEISNIQESIKQIDVRIARIDKKITEILSNLRLKSVSSKSPSKTG